MSLATPTELKAMFTEFASLSDPTVQLYLDTANLEINTDRWGDHAKFAEMLTAAHQMTVNGVLAAASGAGGGGAVSGPITSQQVGDVSVSYANSGTAAIYNGINASLAGSRYGLELQRIASLKGFGFFVPGADTSCA